MAFTGATDFVDLDDVGMVEFRRGPCFAAKTFDIFRIARELPPQDFERHLAIERLVQGNIHVGHPAAAKTAEDLIIVHPGADQVSRTRLGR